MATFSEKSGGAARCRLTPLNQTAPFASLGGGVFYTIAGWTIKDETETGDTTNTESQLDSTGACVAGEEIPTKAKLTITLKKATYDAANNFFTVPLNLARGIRVMFEMFANASGGSVALILPIGLIKGRTWEGEAGGLQPMTLELVSVGTWTDQT